LIKVLHPGFYSTIQDLGRYEFQHLGVPISGAMDYNAATMANAIVGNEKNCAIMEITMLGPKLEFHCSTVISVVGGDFSPKLNGIDIYNNSAINISKGDLLTFGNTKNGFRAYLSVLGGFQSEVVLKSRSMYHGITEGSSLKKNSLIKIKSTSHSKSKHSSVRVAEDYILKNNIEVFKGPEFEKLNKTQINKIFSSTFSISKENNRMAYQINEKIDNNLKDILTSLVLPGTVQLTPSGKMIVLMRDCQTTGGYPRILQLSESSINSLAQKKVGDVIKFKLLDYNF
jgi:biotin-dependent carboxylase-like uncharacterized protein